MILIRDTEHGTHHAVTQADCDRGMRVASNRPRVEAAVGAQPWVLTDRHIVPHVGNLPTNANKGLGNRRITLFNKTEQREFRNYGSGCDTTTMELP